MFQNLPLPAAQEVRDSSSGVTSCIVMKNDVVLYQQVSYFGKAMSENRCFCDKMKSIVLSNYVMHDAEKKKLINQWEINKRKVEKTQLRASLVNHSQFKTIDHKFLESGHFSCPMTGVSVAYR